MPPRRRQAEQADYADQEEDFGLGTLGLVSTCTANAENSRAASVEQAARLTAADARRVAELAAAHAKREADAAVQELDLLGRVEHPHHVMPLARWRRASLSLSLSLSPPPPPSPILPINK